MRYKKINSDLFIQNRAKFIAQMAPKSIAVFHSSDLMPRSADQTHAFRQQPDTFYLTGIDQEETILILFPDSPIPAYREVLFIRETNEHIAVWEGAKHTQADASNFSGIETVLWNDKFDQIFGMLMHHCENVYLNTNENDRAASAVVYKDLAFAHQCQRQFPLHNYKRSAPIMADLRVKKSALEIELMQRACDITEGAFRRILEFTKPGVMEYEIEAELIHEYISQGGNGHAYEPIVAAGGNACVLHYVDNNTQVQDGDLILIDSGADYANYAADLSRTYPANGKFTDRQKAVYNATLRVQKETIQLLTHGMEPDTYNAEIAKMFQHELVGLGIFDDLEAAEQGYKKYTCHGIGHYIGLDVHDIGNRYRKMENGMVFTVEPGIYLPEENIGVRIENDIVVTENGPFDLMAEIPREVEEIEDIMNS